MQRRLKARRPLRRGEFAFAIFRRLPLAVAAALAAFGIRAAEIPALVLPEGLGVNIHFNRGHERDLDLIAAAGFKFTREDFFWETTERKKGQYDWSAYDELTGNLERRGIRPYYIFDYSNPLYDRIVAGTNPITGKIEKTSASPQDAESIDAFARWAAAAAEHFRGRHVIWEIWNEPNISFWKPKPDAHQYTALALATCRAVRQADPEATIVAPATSGFAWDFLDDFLKSGALEYLDGVSAHPYRSPKQPPESAAPEYRRLRDLIERYAPGDKKGKIPIISGEWGYSSNTKGVSLKTQAAFIVRQQLSNLLNGVPVSVWYDWKNDGADPNENEHNFGTVTENLTPKPAYLAIQTLSRELSGYRITSRFGTGDTDDFVLVLTNGMGETKLAAWTLGEAHPVTLALPAAPARQLTVVHGDGQSEITEIKNDSAVVLLDDQPKYIALGKAFSSIGK